MRKYAVLFVCLLLLSASTARAEFYRWVDKDGKEFFTNEQEKVPQEYRNSAVPVRTDDGRVRIEEKHVATENPSPPPKDHTDKYGRGEDYWRKRAAKLRKELGVLQDRYDQALKQERDDERKPEKLSARKSATRNKKRSSLEKKKSAIEKSVARKKYELESELPEEARKANAYPGWLRE